MKMSSTLGFFAPLMLASIAHAEVRPGENVPVEPVQIKKVLYNGSGCPLNTVASNIADDKTSFTLTFSEFVAEAGPNISLANGRRNCTMTLVLDVPAGWQYSVASFYYRGFMQLDEGIKAEHGADYFFEGQGLTGRFGTNKVGPLSSEYVYNDNVGLASSIWSPCQEERALNINAKIRVSNTDTKKYPTARGLITNDSVDGIIKQVWGLTWKRCAQ